MPERETAREEALVPVELFARGKLRAVLLVDLSLGGAQLQIPADLALAPGETVLIRPYGLPSALAYVRWALEGHAGLEFRHKLHPSLMQFTLGDYSKSQPFARAGNGGPTLRAA